MATMCATPSAFTVAEPDTTAEAFAQIVADFHRPTETGQASALTSLRMQMNLRLADQGDPEALAIEKENAEWWDAKLKERQKEKAKIAPLIEKVKRARQCAYEALFDALEGTEALQALHDHGALTFHLETLEHPD